MTLRKNSVSALFPAASPDLASAAESAKLTRTDDLVSLVLVLAYAVVEIALFAGHTPWRDEAQAWLLAETLSRPMDFLIIPAEGHPPLWFWLLRALSTLFSFEQARYLTLTVAILNALLLWRVLRGQVLLLALVLCNSVILLQWGYHFRPYSLVLTTILAALLLDRSGRGVAATWVLAIGCGLHFFTGFVFALWLLLQWRRGIGVTRLIGPSVLAAAFGASALISGMNNPEASSNLANLIPGTLDNLSWWMPGDNYRHPVASLAYVGLLALGLWRSPFILGALLIATVAFAAGTAVVYGEHPWHAAFIMVMAITAFVAAGTKAQALALALVLLPNAVVGMSNVRNSLQYHPSGDIDIYRSVQADAGMTIIPTQQLVAWPDYMLASAAASEEFTYRSGNNGATLGPIDWRTRVRTAIDPGLTTLPTPYWLVCKDCPQILDFIAASGRTPTPVGSALNFSDGHIYAFRID